MTNNTTDRIEKQIDTGGKETRTMTKHMTGTRDEWLDRAPKGRNETGPWVRRHDEYARRCAAAMTIQVDGEASTTCQTCP
jgi:predicted dithiol-disulfide oxidoreductase (DUF899 family)